MVQWSQAIHFVSSKTQATLNREFQAQIAATLPQASKAHLTEVTDYVVKMGAAPP